MLRNRNSPTLTFFFFRGKIQSLKFHKWSNKHAHLSTHYFEQLLTETLEPEKFPQEAGLCKFLKVGSSGVHV